MADIGSSKREPAALSGREHEQAVRNKPTLWQSLTSSLDLACRGYLCMQLVDCDPLTDPECGPSGKKAVMRPASPDSIPGERSALEMSPGIVAHAEASSAGRESVHG